jgi:protein ImuA
MTAPRPLDSSSLPPQVWRGRELAQAQESTLATGHAALDAQLPGGGWPLGSLVEVLQQEMQQHVWQLVGPALGEAMRRQGEPAVLVDPPYQPFGPSLRAQGIAPEQLLCVQAVKPSARLWAAEQALRCSEVCAVLAWLPQARG